MAERVTHHCCSRRSVLLGTLGVAAATLTPAGLARAAAADAPRLRDGGPPQVGGMSVLAGSLHDHSTDSDGDARTELIADYVHRFHRQLALDFLSFTEHSDFFPNAPLRAAGSAPAPDVDAENVWPHIRKVTDSFTGDGFTLLRGFEWTNDQQNHLNVIESSLWDRRVEDLQMDRFWAWLAANPNPDVTGTGLGFGGNDGIGQFNHPASKGPLNWDDYDFDAAAARVMGTIEIREGSAGWYWFALAKGWTVGPVQNADYHPWAASKVLANATPGDRSAPGRYPYHRSLVVATDGSRAAIVTGLKARRTTATEQPDLWATLRGPGGAWQGSTVGGAPGQPLELLVDAGTEGSALARVEIVTDGVTADYAEFFGPNGPCVPSAIDNPGLDCSQHTAAYELQRAKFAASGGQVTFKGGKDTPPAGRTLPAVPLSGPRAQVRIPVTVPTTTSTRPDGKHFFYAVVTRADGARAITSPVFVAAGGPTPVVPEVPVAAALPLAGVALGAAYLALRGRSQADPVT